MLQRSENEFVPGRRDTTRFVRDESGGVHSQPRQHRWKLAGRIDHQLSRTTSCGPVEGAGKYLLHAVASSDTQQLVVAAYGDRDSVQTSRHVVDHGPVVTRGTAEYEDVAGSAALRCPGETSDCGARPLTRADHHRLLPHHQ